MEDNSFFKTILDNFFFEITFIGYMVRIMRTRSYETLIIHEAVYLF
ncbi:MAG: hypothetical protein IKN91_02080 [Paludibacteraceae bacterium]|nr:hypothetical protein [Paludibacteraceae bacterium]